MGPPIIQFPLTCAEINNMISIGDTTIKRSRYRNPVGELGGFQLHQTKPAGLVWVKRPPVMIAKRVTRTSGDR